MDLAGLSGDILVASRQPVWDGGNTLLETEKGCNWELGKSWRLFKKKNHLRVGEGRGRCSPGRGGGHVV